MAIKNEPTPFISRSAEYIYYLTNLKGRQRMDALEVSGIQYETKSAARRWMKDIETIISSDDYGAKEALAELSDIYKIMTNY